MIFGKSLGILIDDEKLQFCLLTKRLNQTQLVDLLTISGGESLNLETAKEQVALFLRKNRTTHYQGLLLVPRTSVVLRHMEVPKEAAANLQKVVQYQLATLVPSDDTVVVSGYHVSRENPEAKTLQVSLFLIPESILEGPLTICQKLGLSVRSVAPTFVALANLVGVLRPKLKNTAAVLSYGNGNQCEFVGLLNGGIRQAKVLQAKATEDSASLLGAEVNLFRGQARLPDEGVLQLCQLGKGWELGDEGAVKTKVDRLLQSSEQGLNLGKFAAERSRVETHVLPLSAALMGSRRKPPIPLNLLPERKRVRHSGWVWIPTYALVVANIALALILLCSKPWLDRRYALTLESEIHRLEPEVKKVRSVEDQIQALQKRTGLLNQLKQSQTQILEALNELAKILPKSSYLFDLTLKNQMIEIYGTSDAVASLPQILDGSPYFKGSEFVGGISRDANGKEVFRIRTKLRATFPAVLTEKGQTTTRN
ncbi:MAG: PilN domain-containing protein [Terriglobia bacterium]